MRIHQLSTQLSNQIAAGEVIERPASVIKELIENSLDAGATEIVIEVEQGGEKLLCVRDNGCGIHPEDLGLALDRHATSKIFSSDDLIGIQTLGFRGEALASMSSVSRLELHSRSQEAEIGWKIFSEGKNPPQQEPSAQALGTSVIVRDLFFNTPARKKFLKNERIEFSHIEQVVKRIALSHFDVGFRLSHNQRMVFHLPRALDLAEKEKRVALLAGQAFLQHAFFLEVSSGSLRLSGWFAEPTFSRSQADTQYFYINQRAIKDKVITHAIREAYADVLYNQRHPAYILFLDMDPKGVDVNAHPTKHEVRFRDSRLVHDFVLRSLKEAIANIRPSTTFSQEVPRFKPNHAEAGLGTSSSPSSATQYQMLYQMESSPDKPLWQTNNLAPKPLVETPIPPLGYALGQLKGIYILAENAAGLVLVDMHAAHERILYEEMKKTHRLVGQPLLLPISFSVRIEEANLVDEHQAILNALGLSVSRLGPETIVIDAVPDLLKKADIKQLVQDILADLMVMGSSERLEETLNELMGNMACKAAIKANDKLTLAEMNAILRDIEHLPRGGQCNHGRPTWIQLTLEELDKLFLRGR